MIPTESAMAALAIQLLKAGDYIGRFTSNKEVMAEQKWDFSVVGQNELKYVITSIIEIAYARARLIYYLTQGHLFECFVPQWYVEETFSWRAHCMRGKSDEDVEAELNKYWLPDLADGVAERFSPMLINVPPDVPLKPLSKDVMNKLEKLLTNLVAATIIDASMTKAVDVRLSSIGKSTVKKLLLPAFLERMKTAVIVDPPLKVREYEPGALDLDLTSPVFSVLEIKERSHATMTNAEAYAVLTGGVEDSDSTDGEDIDDSNCVTSDSEEEDETVDPCTFIQDEPESSEYEESESQEEDDDDEGGNDGEGGSDAGDDGDGGTNGAEEEDESTLPVSALKRKRGQQGGGPTKSVRFADEEDE